MYYHFPEDSVLCFETCWKEKCNKQEGLVCSVVCQDSVLLISMFCSVSGQRFIDYFYMFAHCKKMNNLKSQ